MGRRDVGYTHEEYSPVARLESDVNELWSEFCEMNILMHGSNWWLDLDMRAWQSDLPRCIQ